MKCERESQTSHTVLRYSLLKHILLPIHRSRAASNEKHTYDMNGVMCTRLVGFYIRIGSQAIKKYKAADNICAIPKEWKPQISDLATRTAQGWNRYGP